MKYIILLLLFGCANPIDKVKHMAENYCNGRGSSYWIIRYHLAGTYRVDCKNGDMIVLAPEDIVR